MRVIKWDTPIRLSKLYQFQLNSSDLPQAIAWDKVPGQHKMRQFFADPEWHEKIDDIDYAGGAQGGVLFLRAKKRSYVVKLVDAPERVLFAEFVLRQVAKAKVPKSLVVELNWDDLRDDYAAQLEKSYQSTTGKFNRDQFNTGLKSLDHPRKLLSFIFCDGLLSPELKSNKEGKLDNLKQLIRDRLKDSAKRPDYLIVMKSLSAGERDFDPFKRVVDPFALPKQDWTYSYMADRGFDLADFLGSESGSVTLDQTKSAYYIGNVFQDYRTNKGLLRLIARILITKQMFSNKELMIKAGRILAADTLLGNSDRFEGTEGGLANVGNVFFFSKKYHDRQKLGKADNPVGVIDSDAFLPSLEEFNNNIDDYLKFILEDGWSDIKESRKKLRESGFRISQLKNLLENFEQRILLVLMRSLFKRGRFGESKLRIELWEDNGKFFGYEGKYKAFTDPFRIAEERQIAYDKVTQANILQFMDNNWKQTVAWIKQGFIDGIKDLLAFRGYRSVWAHLVGLYGINGSQSDFTAFVVRHKYMRYVDTTGNSFQFQVKKVPADHKAVVTEIKNWLQQRTKPIAAIAEALTFGTDNSLIDEREVAYISQFVEQLDQNEQGKIVTQYTSSSIKAGRKNENLKNRIMAINLALAKFVAAHMETYTDTQIKLSNAEVIKKNERFLRYLNTCDLTNSKLPASGSDPHIALKELLDTIPDTQPNSQRTKFKSFIMLKSA